MKLAFISIAIGVLIATLTFFVVRPHVSTFAWAFVIAFFAYAFSTITIYGAFEAIEEGR